MIVFDLRCTRGHVFEAWFASSAAYDAQRSDGSLACPVCGDGQIDKAVMAPAVAAKVDGGGALCERAAGRSAQGRRGAPRKGGGALRKARRGVPHTAKRAAPPHSYHRRWFMW